jgi:tetratricopeptide (TPR) repeat protein
MKQCLYTMIFAVLNISYGYTQIAAEHYGKGNRFTRQGEYAEAIASYTAAFNLEPQRFEALFRRAQARVDLQDFDAAIVDYTLLLKLTPPDSHLQFSSHLNRANVRMAIQDYADAEEDYTACILEEPRQSEFYNTRGVCRGQLHRDTAALHDFTKAIELQSRNASSYLNRSNIKRHLEDYLGALADCTEALRLEPSMAEGYYNRGLILAENLNRVQDACLDFRKAVAKGVRVAIAEIDHYCSGQ